MASDPDRLPQRVRAYADAHAMPTPPATLVVGASGGADSTVLVRVLHGLGYRLHLAHVNYGLRAEAAGDESFVRGLAAELGRPAAVHQARLAFGANVQARARDVRYEFFRGLVREAGAAGVALGHHLGDQAETLLLRMLRGTGPEGLGGMAPVSRRRDGLTVLRPLLDEQRSTLRAYAQANGWAWREDASNQTRAYARNRLRQELAPLLRRDDVVRGLGHTAELMRAYANDVLAPAIEAAWAAAVTDADERALQVKPLQALPRVLRRRVLLEALRRWMPDAAYTQTSAATLDGLLAGQPGRRHRLGDAEVWRLHDRLAFGVTAQPVEGACYVEPESRVAWGAGVLYTEVLPEPPADPRMGAPSVLHLDADRLSFPLLLRGWHPGDRIQPLGMEGTKPVSDVLMEARLPAHRRAGVAVLVSDGAIVSILGLRIAHPWRVRPSTQRVLRCRWETAGET